MVERKAVAGREERHADSPKEVAFYQAMLGAWVTTRMELDKTLVTLAAGGIAVLVTLLTTVGVADAHETFLYGGALLGFLVTICSAVFVFRRNARYLQRIIRGKDASDPALKAADNLALASFILALVLATILGLSAATTHLNRRPTAMAEDENDSSNSAAQESARNEAGREQGEESRAIESLEGASELVPERRQPELEERSLEGAGRLRPGAEDPGSDSGGSDGQGDGGNDQTGSTDTAGE